MLCSVCVRRQVPNAAWNNFLIDGLGFTDWMIGVVSIAGAIFAWLGQSASQPVNQSVSDGVQHTNHMTGHGGGSSGAWA